MMIEVCGPGCPRCQATGKNVLQALKELGMELGEEAMVVEIKDIKQIGDRGVIMTPAVVIDGVKVCEGRIPNPQEVREWLEERR
ncbi:MAG: thioredoxin family protein [Dehalococcoidales bacterium]|nr:thioredoxin family protein [Dehalococcoidales bacterium]